MQHTKTKKDTSDMQHHIALKNVHIRCRKENHQPEMGLGWSCLPYALGKRDTFYLPNGNHKSVNGGAADRDREERTT